MNELKELKNTTQELRKACTSFNSWIDQAEERISEDEDQLNEIKRETKIGEKSAKRNEQSLQEMWDYVKRPNLHLIDVPTWMWQGDWIQAGKHSSGYYLELPQLSKASQHSNPGKTGTPQRYSSRRAIPRHIIIRLTRVEMKEKMLREAREKGWVTHKGKAIRLTAYLLAKTL